MTDQTKVNTGNAKPVPRVGDEGDVNWSRIDTSLDYGGKKIVLPGEPENMPISAAVETLMKIEEQENQVFDVFEVIPGAPWDAAVAFYRAMQDIYGVVLSKPGFWGSNPTFLTVNTGPGSRDRIQVPVGRLEVPGVSKPIELNIYPAGAYITGSVRRRDRARLIEIAEKAKEFLRTQSVYRAKTIRIGVDNRGELNISQQPEFIDLSRVTVGDMIHTAETQKLIETNVFSPLINTEACRRNRIPLKRGILLEGPYGTGKSLTARVTAKVANDNGWTMIILDRSNGLKAAIEFAKNYQPCVIFAEDIDRAADRDNESVNDLVNLIDGVISKDSEIMTILTTNFVEKIDRSLLRPGRFDAVISIQVPDADTAEKLVRAYARDLLDPQVDITKVGKLIAGQIPATIREVVERAKLSMLMESRAGLNADDLETSAIGMKRHLELLNPKVTTDTAKDRLWRAMREVTGAGVGVYYGEEDEDDQPQLLQAAE